MSYRKSLLLSVGLGMMLPLGAASITMGEDAQEHLHHGESRTDRQ